MSVISFICKEEDRDALKEGVRKALRDHYFLTVLPNSNVKYENEGKDVYLARLDELMNNSLCSITDTEDGISVEFDLTEDAGYQITSEVYHTSMGYNDNGLSEINMLFEKIIKAFPKATFESDYVLDDGYSYEESHYSYNGKKLLKNGLDYKLFDQIYEMMYNGRSMEQIAKKLGIPLDVLEAAMPEE